MSIPILEFVLQITILIDRQRSLIYEHNRRQIRLSINK